MRSILCLVTVLVLSCPLDAQEMASWNNVSGGIKESEILSIGVAPWNSQEVYAGTPSGIYQTTDHGAHWKKVMAVKGSDTAVYCVSFSAKGNDFIYAGTGNGLYRSSDYGRHWQQVFRGGAGGERAVFWIESDPNDSERIYAAAALGLFISQDGGKTWEAVKTLPVRSPARRILCHPGGEELWAAADSGIFYSEDRGKSWERIWVSPSETTEEVVVEEPNETGEELSSTQKARHIVLQSLGEGKTRVLAGTSQGLLVQSGDLSGWETFPQFGVTAREVRFITIHPKDGKAIFAGTDQGVYRWDGEKDHWENFSSGMVGQRIHELEFSKSGDRLWAATDKGIYYIKLQSLPFSMEQKLDVPNFLTPQEMMARYRYEPTIEQVQRWAIHHAEVEPEKIERWRRQAKMKAYLPDLSISAGKDRGTTVDLDRGGTNDPDRYIIGPEDRAFNMDVSLSWDLGDLIWNDDQTSIDVRSRLMVQLRDDILDEVTRLYFERRRLQIDRELAPTKDVRLQVAQELRLQELTAQIDGLTGGEFSRRLDLARDEDD